MATCVPALEPGHEQVLGLICTSPRSPPTGPIAGEKGEPQPARVGAKSPKRLRYVG